LAHKKQNRYATIKEFADDLRRYQAGQAVSVYHDNIVHMLWMWIRRNQARTLVSLGFILSAGIIIFLIVAQYQKQTASWLMADQMVTTTADVDKFDHSWQILSNTFGWNNPDRIISVKDEQYFKPTADGFILHSKPGNFTDLVSKVDFTGSVRMSWEARSVADGLDLNCLIGAGNRRDGYLFSIGGWTNPCYLACSTSGGARILGATYIEKPFAAHVFHRFVMERDGGNIRLSINGKQYFNFPDVLTDF
jgi:hypothetical protein